MANKHELFDLVLEHTSELFFLVNRTFQIRSTTLAETEFTGRKILDFVDGNHHPRLRRAVNEVFSFNLPENLQVKARFFDEWRWYSGRAIPVSDNGSAVVSMCLIIMGDITERRETELQNKRHLKSKERDLLRQRAINNVLSMCAYTKKVRFKGEWISVEEFLWQQYGFKISHGLSPEGLEIAEKELSEVLPEKD